jgi:UDP-N-acetylmuramyl pentapeptide phosphotransferase/UDP-N-acetylglucosamine-1-phosphate transferase/nucleoside-diphosphate-sugar epimerase
VTVLVAAAAALAIVVSLSAPYAVIPWLTRIGAMDVPSERSLHVDTAVRGVGLAPLLALAVGLGVVLLGQASDARALVLVALVSVAAALLGAAEDIRGLSIRTRAGAQFGLGIVGGGTAIVIADAPWWLLPILAVGIAGYINVANFMDGVNGISSLHGLVVGLTFVVIGSLAGVAWLIPAGLVLACAFIGFLPWNLLRKGTFLGDVGSYLLGGGISIIAALAVADGVNPVAVVAPLSIYLADTSFTLARRIARGERWTESHRSHVFQRLATLGLTHVQSALVVTTATVLASAVGLFALDGTVTGVLLAVSGILVVAAVYLSLPSVVTAGRRTKAVPSGSAPEAEAAGAEGYVREPSRWAVIGATGFIGGSLVEELRARGLDVVELSAPRLALPSAATSADILSRVAAEDDVVDALGRSLRDVDVVVNAAGLAAPDSSDSPELYGANALLPAVVAASGARAGVRRLVHLSSAAVQGRRAVLDESSETSPFSPYSRSKALGESALLAHAAAGAPLEIVVVRATSVQGPTRSTTRQLQRLARSPLASVASPGTLPTVVSSVRGLVSFVARVGAHPQAVPLIVLQPWEGLSTAETLRLAGGKDPVVLPAALCRALVAIGYTVARVLPPLNGMVRRVELMWLGQAQDARWAASVGVHADSFVAEVLRDGPAGAA